MEVIKKKYIFFLLVFGVFIFIHYPKPKITKIYSWSSYSAEDESYLYVISNPPMDELELAKMIFVYLKEYAPAKFANGEARALFYKESSVTPIDGNRPEASWWEQPLTDPAIKYKEIDNDKEIATSRISAKNGDLEITYLGEYGAKGCNGEKQAYRTISFRDDGSISSRCD